MSENNVHLDFHDAIRENKMVQFKKLLKHNDLDLTKEDNIELEWICHFERYKQVELILKSEKLNLDNYKGKALIIAVERGCYDIVKLLLEDGRINPNLNNNMAICEAVLENHIDILRLLLNDKRTNPADYYNFAIVTAMDLNNIEMALLLFKDKRVKNDLKNEHPKLFKTILHYMKKYNIKNF